MNDLLTASRLNSFMTCMRKHYLSYELGFRSIGKAAPLRIGTAWANGMEARWNGGLFDKALSAALPKGVDLDGTESQIIAGLLTGYYARYGAKDELIAKSYPEVQFDTSLPGSRSFRVAGKIDLLGQLVDGRLAVLESKTCGDSIAPDSDYWMRLKFNPQILQYVIAARDIGWDVETVIYDVTRKPSIRVKQKESIEEYGNRLAQDTIDRPDFYFQRREVPILDQDIEEFKAQRLVISRQILACRVQEQRQSKPEQAWPRNLGPMVCNWCEFKNFCLQNLTINKEQPPAGFRIGKKHEELTHENSTPTTTQDSNATISA